MGYNPVPLLKSPNQAAMRDTLPARVRFGAFELDLRSGELCSAPVNGSPSMIVLAQQPFHLLLLLMERDGAMVTREEIRKRFWPNDSIIEFDHSINVAIGKLRKALGDSSTSPNTSRQWPAEATGCWRRWNRSRLRRILPSRLLNRQTAALRCGPQHRFSQAKRFLITACST